MWCLLQAKEVSAKIFITSNKYGSDLNGKKILALSSESTDIHELINGTYEKMFAMGKKLKEGFLRDLNLDFKFVLGVASKVPKKMAKKICETILGKSVVMVHTKSLY